MAASVVDLNDNTITLTYNLGFPVSLSNSSGRSVSLSWSGSHLESLTFNNASCSYIYENGYLKEVTNPQGYTESYQYLANGKMSVIADYNHNPVYIEYSDGTVVKKIESCLSEKSFSYTGNKTFVIENGSSGKQITCYTYDDQERVIQITTPNHKSLDFITITITMLPNSSTLKAIQIYIAMMPVEMSCQKPIQRVILFRGHLINSIKSTLLSTRKGIQRI